MLALDPNKPLSPSVVKALEHAGIDPASASWAQAINVLGAQGLTEILNQATTAPKPAGPVTTQAPRTGLPPQASPASTFTCPSCGWLLIVGAV